MNKRYAVHLAAVDGQTTMTFDSDTAVEALAFLTREDHEGSSITLVHTLHGVEAYEFLQQRTHDEEMDDARASAE